MATVCARAGREELDLFAGSSDGASLSVTVIHLSEEAGPDVDNIPKPIIGGLKGLAFDDDSLVTDLISRRRDLKGTFRELERAPATLVSGFELGTEFVYVRVADAPPQDELT